MKFWTILVLIILTLVSIFMFLTPENSELQQSLRRIESHAMLICISTILVGFVWGIIMAHMLNNLNPNNGLKSIFKYLFFGLIFFVFLGAVAQYAILQALLLTPFLITMIAVIIRKTLGYWSKPPQTS